MILKRIEIRNFRFLRTSVLVSTAAPHLQPVALGETDSVAAVRRYLEETERPHSQKGYLVFAVQEGLLASALVEPYGGRFVDRRERLGGRRDWALLRTFAAPAERTGAELSVALNRLAANRCGCGRSAGEAQLASPAAGGA